MGYSQNVISQIALSECYQNIIGQYNNINFIPNFAKCQNPIMIGLPNITSGNSTAIAHGYGIPNYNNGTFVSYLDAMAIPVQQRNLNRIQLPYSFVGVNQSFGGVQTGCQKQNPLTELGKMIFILDSLNSARNEINADYNRKLDINDIIEDAIEDAIEDVIENVIEDVIEEVIDIIDEFIDQSSENNLNSINNEQKINIKNVLIDNNSQKTSQINVSNKLPQKVKLTDELINKREEIINSVENTWYGARDEWSESRAISKMESLSDDEFIAMFGDKSYAAEMAERLSSGSNADGVMAYIVKRLHSLAPKNVKIYADTNWADSFVVSTDGARPSFAHELEYEDNIMDGFKNGVDIYEGDFKRAVIDLSDAINKNRY